MKQVAQKNESKERERSRMKERKSSDVDFGYKHKRQVTYWVKLLQVWVWTLISFTQLHQRWTLTEGWERERGWREIQSWVIILMNAPSSRCLQRCWGRAQPFPFSEAAGFNLTGKWGSATTSAAAADAEHSSPKRVKYTLSPSLISWSFSITSAPR